MAMGFVISPDGGEIVGLIVAFIPLTIFLFFGKYLVLSFAKAKRFDDLSINDYVKNYSCIIGMKEIEIYVTPVFRNNLFFAHSIYSKPCLIFGKDLKDNLSDEELKVLVFSAVYRISTKDSLKRTFLSLIFECLNFPFNLLDNVDKGGRIVESIKIVTSFYFLPLQVLKIFLFKNKKELRKIDKKIISLTGKNNELSSAFFNLSKLPFVSNSTSSKPFYNVLFGLAVAENKSRGFVENFIYAGMLTKKRCSSLKI